MAKPGTCPHGCVRCRAIEMGLSGRGLTQEELIAVGGGLVEPSQEGRVEWSAETAEAALSVEVGEVAYEKATQAQGDVLRKLAAARSGQERDRLEEALRFAQDDREEAGTALSVARTRYHSLAQRDSQLHAQAVYQANQAAQAQAREEARKARRSSGRRMLSLIGGGK
jgi:hypothetical protein